MKDLHKYFYSIVAAYFIALGSGFIASMQYTLDFEKEARKLSYEIEEKENIESIRNVECVKLKSNVASCKYALHLFKTNENYLDLLEEMATVIMVFLFASLAIGVSLHYRQIVTTKYAAGP